MALRLLTLAECLIARNKKNRQGINALNFFLKEMETRSSWLNCALRGDEAVYWVSIRQVLRVTCYSEAVLQCAYTMVISI